MVDDDPTLVGAFKTPGLRGVAQRAPYMHAGQMATLEQVVRHYIAAPHAAVGHSELTHRHAGGAAAPKRDERAPIELTDAEVADLVSFLGTLGAEPASAAAAQSEPRSDPGRAALPLYPMNATNRDAAPAGIWATPRCDRPMVVRQRSSIPPAPPKHRCRRARSSSPGLTMRNPSAATADSDPQTARLGP